jgi:hypothetical protein
MKGRLFRTAAATGTVVLLALGVGAGPAQAGGQDAGENGNPRSGAISGNSGFAVCMDGAANEPRCYLGFNDGGKTVVIGQGSDYNGNSIVEQVVLDPAKGDGHSPGTGTYQATSDGIKVHVFFVYLGILDLTVKPDGSGAPAASGAGCGPNRFAYNIASSNAGIHKLSGLEGNLHVFGQDYPLTASKSQGECGAVWSGPTNGWYFISPPATAANPV